MFGLESDNNLIYEKGPIFKAAGFSICWGMKVITAWVFCLEKDTNIFLNQNILVDHSLLLNEMVKVRIILKPQ